MSGPTASGFDTLAPDYDDDFGTNPIGVWMRKRIWERLDARFPVNSNLLEVGCGTGIDLVHLAGRGHRVTAIDISEGMADTAREKAVAAGLGHLVTVHCGDLSGGELPDELAASAPFDGLLSNFGALNCVAVLSMLPPVLQRLLKPGAPALICLMTRPCPWESAWFLLHGRPREAFRRHRRNGVDVMLGEHAVRTYYDSVGGYRRTFSPCFDVRRCTGLGVLVPPPYLQGLARRFPRLFRLSTGVETLVATCPPFSWCGDHTLFEMTARENRR